MASGASTSRSRHRRGGGGGKKYDVMPEEKLDYFLVLDFEGVNNKFHGGPDIMELIEFPVLKVNAKTFETESIFHSYIQPTIHT